MPYALTLDKCYKDVVCSVPAELLMAIVFINNEGFLILLLTPRHVGCWVAEVWCQLSLQSLITQATQCLSLALL